MANRPITVAHGDGIGPEIMEATLQILKEAGARLEIETIEIGEKVYQRGNSVGHRAQRVGIAAAHQGVSEGADHHAAGRRLQEPERHHAQDARPVRQHPAVRVVSPVRRHQAPEHGRRHRPRERGGPLRRHRASADQRRHAVPEADLAARLARRSSATRSSTRGSNNRKKVTCFTKDNIMKHDRRSVPQGVRRDRAPSTRTSRTSTGSSTSARRSWPTRRKRST